MNERLEVYQNQQGFLAVWNFGKKERQFDNVEQVKRLIIAANFKTISWYDLRGALVKREDRR